MDTQPITTDQQNLPVGAGSSRPLEPVIPSVVEGSKSSSHLLPIILSSLITVIIIVGIIIVGIYFLFLNKKSQPSTTIPSPTPIPSVLSLVSADPISNWKTYTNSTYGFSFSYPPNWNELTTEEEKTSGNIGYTNRSTIIETDKKEIISSVVFEGDVKIGSKDEKWSKSINIGNDKFVSLSYVECLGPACKNGQQDIQIFEQILSTFKFTN